MILPKLHLVTTAPENYDYGRTRVVDSNYGTFMGRPCRLVAFEDETDMNYQAGRYGSGNHLTIMDSDRLNREIDGEYLKLNK